ncbi:MAG: GTP 3',8-cyclase MoaA [Bacteroidia bacterium]|nr:GTP 3',8-cyclase MoaA [Bacteroidia bacterium]
MLRDQHGRKINYLRLAVTDRCNLRCFYCMPAAGIKYKPRKELLTYEEILRFVGMTAPLGIEKLRITGGEPFLRKDIMGFIHQLSQIEGIKKIHITTNGTRTEGLVSEFKKVGISSVNLSLDSLDKERFFKITRRDEFETVMSSLESLVSHGIPTKINAVVMEGKNIEDILPMVELTKDMPVDVRFIEEMPFNGTGKENPKLTWDYIHTLKHIQAAYPSIKKIKDKPHSTSFNYQIPGHKGSVGFIAAYTRLFCGSCNRIRLTPSGMLKTCLYDDGVLDLKNLMRSGVSDEEVITALNKALSNRAKDGFEAEQRRKEGKPISESMATIGG